MVQKVNRQLPNILSLSRVGFLFITTMLLRYQFKHHYLLSFISVILSCITDYLDGKTARKYKIVSKFGSIFDSISDKVFVVGILVVMVSERLYPQQTIYAALIILAREFLISGLRIMAAAKGVVLSAERSGKIKTAVTMVAICMTIGSKMIDEELTIFNFRPQILLQINSIIYYISLVLYLISSILALQSAYSYLSKYGYMMIESDEVQQKKSTE